MEMIAKKPPKTLAELSAEVTQRKAGSENKRQGKVVDHEEESAGGGGDGGKDEATCEDPVQTAQVNSEPSGQQNLEPVPANVRDSSSASSETVVSAQRLADDGADVEKERWESFVVEFQEEMQEYRTMVVLFAEGEESCDFESAERRLRSIGHRLAQTAEDTKTDATKKTRARQLLQYVSDYCQSHGRDELHAAFVVYIASCTKG
jgi:hypothetical protein